jgi:putative endonuclease
MREYFYKDLYGRLRKYTYCIRGCPEPYREDQIGKEIIKATDKTFMCVHCAKSLNIATSQTDKFVVRNIELPVKQEPKTIEKTSDLDNEVLELDIEQHDVVEEIIQEKTQVQSEIQIEEKPIQKFFALVVKCSDGTYYCGTTSDVEKAIKTHNRGSGSEYTKSRRPVIFVESKEAISLEEAKKIRAELQLKYKN